MVEPQPAEQRARRFSWTSWLDDWRLRTKVAVVLSIPVIVALVLGGMRVSSQWDEASRLSSVRDQVTVLRGVIDLASLVDKETITAVAATPPEGLDIKVRAAAVDQKSAEVQNAADQAGLPPEVGRALSAAIGRLSALRSAGQTDPVTATAGYHEVVGHGRSSTPSRRSRGVVRACSRSRGAAPECRSACAAFRPRRWPVRRPHPDRGPRRFRPATRRSSRRPVYDRAD